MNNKIYDALGSVRAEEALKRNTKAFLASKTTSVHKSVSFMRMAAAFACLALVLLGFGGWRLYVTPVSAISVDVNPSIELGVNRFDRVVSVTGYNNDGTALASAVNLKNLNYSDALDTLLSSEEMKPYRENDGLVSITVIGRTEQKSEEMRNQIASCEYAASPNVECRCGKREDIASAHEFGLSFGKYMAFLELQALDPSISADDIKGLTMRQIWDWIDELSGSSNSSQRGNSPGGYRNSDGQNGMQYQGRN